MRSKRHWLYLSIWAAFLLPLSLGGCEMKCDCNGNDVEDVVDEIGDEVEDAVEKFKDD